MSKYLKTVVYPRHREARKLSADKLYGCHFPVFPVNLPPTRLRFK
jgi:uroporphyrinogen-III synthase